MRVPDGLAVRIPGFHPGGPGSTPGQGASPFPPLTTCTPTMQTSCRRAHSFTCNYIHHLSGIPPTSAAFIAMSSGSVCR
uniref:Uncharacterized protein n=1 Tax=Mesocestoides corti TaxID=53468 RepID=A0A5K3G1Y9_MESCO